MGLPPKYRKNDVELRKQSVETLEQMWERYFKMPGGEEARKLLARITGRKLTADDLQFDGGDDDE